MLFYYFIYIVFSILDGMVQRHMVWDSVDNTVKENSSVSLI